MAKLNENGRVIPYKTKTERIQELEETMERIAAGDLTAEQCVELARSMRRTDGRWRKESPRSYEAIRKAEEAGS